MDLKIGDRVYPIPDECPVDAPKKKVLRRHLRAHGPESFLTSKKLSPFAGCVSDELLREGAEVVEPEGSADSSDTAAPEPSFDVPDALEPQE